MPPAAPTHTTGRVRRDDLFQAAMRVVLRDGPDVPMCVVAAEAGVTKPVLYRHFTDRDTLMRLLVDELGAGLLATFEATFTDPICDLYIGVGYLLAAWDNHPELGRFLLYAAPDDTHTPRMTRQLGGVLASWMLTEPGAPTARVCRTWGLGAALILTTVAAWRITLPTQERPDLNTATRALSASIHAFTRQPF